MSLPEIADIVIYAPVLIPSRDGPYIAGEDQQADGAADHLPVQHRGGSRFIHRWRHVVICALPSSASAIRSRVPSVVSGGSSEREKKPQAMISRFGSGRRSWVKAL